MVSLLLTTTDSFIACSPLSFPGLTWWFGLTSFSWLTIMTTLAKLEPRSRTLKVQSQGQTTRSMSVSVLSCLQSGCRRSVRRCCVLRPRISSRLKKVVPNCRKNCCLVIRSWCLFRGVQLLEHCRLLYDVVVCLCNLMLLLLLLDLTEEAALPVSVRCGSTTL